MEALVRRDYEWDAAGYLRFVRETTPTEVIETRNVCRLGGARRYRDRTELEGLRAVEAGRVAAYERELDAATDHLGNGAG